MMNTISIMVVKPKFASIAQPVMAIDGTPVYNWVKLQIFDHDGNDETCSLVPAQTWLHNEDESSIAWKLLEPAYDGSTIVPLLVCPDDMDLNCTVVVVEQVVKEQTVEWRRFGLCTNHMNGVITSVNWSDSAQDAVFNRTQFQESVEEFKRLGPDY